MEIRGRYHSRRSGPLEEVLVKFKHGAVTTVEQWSADNKFQLNPDKCKELIIDFKRSKRQFDAVIVNSKELELVDHAKGVTISNTLQWNCHVSDVIQKANKRIYFLIMLKCENVPAHVITCFYNTIIRPVLEYCTPLYHHAVPAYLSDDLERVQKRALSVISPGLSYHDSLALHNISSLRDRRIEQCNKLFESVVSDSDRKLHHLLPPKNTNKHNTRNQRQFALPKMCTKRFSNTFIPSKSNR